MQRPLATVAVLYTGGVLAGAGCPLPLDWLLTSALALAVVAVLLARLRLLLLYPLLVLCGWANYVRHTEPLSPHDLRLILGDKPALVTVRGRLLETPALRIAQQDGQPAWRSLARIEAEAIQIDRQEWRPASGQVAAGARVVLTNFFAGQRVEVFGVSALPRLPAAPGTFDYRNYLRQQGVYYHLQTGTDQDWKILESPAHAPLADRFREAARRLLAIGLPCEDESLRLEWALTLGWKPALTPEVSEPFVLAATYHIFAVDGLRMAIIFGIFFGLLRALTVPRPVCGLVLLPLIWFYVALTGWPASAIRATVMLSLVILSWVLKRPTDLLNSLFAAAVIILVWQPQQLFQAGFQLSFLVVLCMILMLPPLKAWLARLAAPDPLLPPELRRRWPAVFRVPARFLEDVALASFAAWAGSIPLVAYYFHVITPVSTPANVLAVPVCALVLISNLASLLLAGWFPAAAELFNHAGWGCMELIRTSSHWFARWPAAYYYVPAPGLETIALYYGLLLLLLAGWFKPARWRWAKIGGCAVALLAWALSRWPEVSTTRLTVIPLSGGAAVYVDHPGGRNDLLVDCGNTNAVEFSTKAFLQAQGVNHLPRLVLTHGDLKHIGGAQIVAETFRAGQVCVSPLRFRSTAYRKLVQQFDTVPGLVRRVSCNDRLGPWQVVHPEADDRFSQGDDGALVLWAEIEGARILLLSDLGRLGQRALRERNPELRADLVVTGLPTQFEALSDALLDALRPQAIIVADSEYPASEQARSEFRERLNRRNLPVLYTRQSGAATIELRQGRWAILGTDGTRISGRGFGGRLGP